jgi:ribosomal protein L11 methyltransferase
MQYIKVNILVPEEFANILIAELNEIQYDSFASEGDQLDAYVAKEHFNESELKFVVEKYKDLFSVEYSYADMEEKNWNEEWEKNFDPVRVSDKCLIRASFHESDPNIPLEVIINPKMSFGTGHHETTSMMVENQLAINHKGKKVMDAGSGTGILAIVAEKLGSQSVLAFDIEDWAYNNMLENVELNNCNGIEVKQGTIETVESGEGYDILLANINKNVLLQEMGFYAQKLKTNGKLLLSGFYAHDEKDITNRASEFNLIQEKSTYKNNWTCLVFSKT